MTSEAFPTTVRLLRKHVRIELFPESARVLDAGVDVADLARSKFITTPSDLNGFHTGECGATG
jgi:hypothetical protein